MRLGIGKEEGVKYINVILFLVCFLVIDKASAGGLLGDIIRAMPPEDFEKKLESISEEVRRSAIISNCMDSSGKPATANNDPCCLNPNLPICNGAAQ